MKGRTPRLTGLFRRLDAWARGAFPAASTLLLMVLVAAPVGLPSGVPAVTLACVFFWSVFRPAGLPPPICFALGLLEDLLVFAPLGIGILTMLLAHGVAVRFRRFLAHQSFWLVWLVFAGFAAAATLLGFLLQAVLMWRLPPGGPALVQWLLAVGFYPAMAALLTRLHQSMQRSEDLA